MVEESARNAALESVRKAARQVLDFSDSDERQGSVKMAEVLEQALQQFGTPEDIFEAGETLQSEDARVLEEIEQQVRQVDQMVGALCGNPGIYLRLGHSAYYQRENQIAFENYEKALRISPKCSEAWTGKGCVLLRQRNFKDAEDCFDRALTEEPDNPELLYSKAFTAGSQGKLTLAADLCDQALTLNPQVIKIRDFLESSVASDPAALKAFSKEMFQ